MVWPLLGRSAGAAPARDPRLEPDPAAGSDQLLQLHDAARSTHLSPSASPIEDVDYPIYNLVIVVASVAILAAGYLFLKHTRYGIWLRAVAENRPMAASLGVPVPRVYFLAFVLSSGTGRRGRRAAGAGRVGLHDRRVRRDSERLHRGRRRRYGQFPRRRAGRPATGRGRSRRLDLVPTGRRPGLCPGAGDRDHDCPLARQARADVQASRGQSARRSRAGATSHRLRRADAGAARPRRGRAVPGGEQRATRGGVSDLRLAGDFGGADHRLRASVQHRRRGDLRFERVHGGLSDPAPRSTTRWSCSRRPSLVGAGHGLRVRRVHQRRLRHRVHDADVSDHPGHGRAAVGRAADHRRRQRAAGQRWTAAVVRTEPVAGRPVLLLRAGRRAGVPAGVLVLCSARNSARSPRPSDAIRPARPRWATKSVSTA